MKVKITRIDKSLPLPEYQTNGSVACDLYARVETKIKPKEIKRVPGNVIIATPKGYMFLIASRSSTSLRKGLMPANGIGVGDQDFCGPEDEYQFTFFNYTNKTVTVERGERIAQGIFVPIEKASWVEVNSHNVKNRGGFGSTGSHIKTKTKK